MLFGESVFFDLLFDRELFSPKENGAFGVYVSP
jgi:hypothetical protein